MRALLDDMHRCIRSSLATFPRSRTARSPVAPASISIAPRNPAVRRSDGARRDKMRAARRLPPARQGRAAAKIIELISKPAEKVSPWWQYRERFLTERAHRTKARSSCASIARASRRRDGHRRRAGIHRRHHRRRDLLRPHHRQVPRARCARHARLRLPAARRLLPRGARAVHRCWRARRQLDPLTATGSYAGAMGARQFMPSSYRRYAVDGSDDKRATCAPTGTTSSPASLTTSAKHGWVTGGPVVAEACCTRRRSSSRSAAISRSTKPSRASTRGRGVRSPAAGDTRVCSFPLRRQDGPAYRVGFKNFEVITRYNRSVRYAMAVNDLAEISLRAFIANDRTSPVLHQRSTRSPIFARSTRIAATARRAPTFDAARGTPMARLGVGVAGGVLNAPRRAPPPAPVAVPARRGPFDHSRCSSAPRTAQQAQQPAIL